MHDPPRIDESASRPWESWEDEILVKDYRTVGPRGIARGGVLDRSFLAITKRGAALGLNKPVLRKDPMGQAWTEAETNIVLTVHASRQDTGTIDWPKLLAELPGRKRKVIEAKLYSLERRGKPKRAARRKWTAEEDAFVIARYEELAAAKVAEHLGRSVQAVINRAYDLQVTRTHRD